MTKAKQIIEKASFLTENIADSASAIKPVLDKISAVKFKSDQDRKNYIERIQQKFGKPVADLVDKYAGKTVGSYPTVVDPALKSLIDNLNGIIAGNPG